MRLVVGIITPEPWRITTTLPTPARCAVLLLPTPHDPPICLLVVGCQRSTPSWAMISRTAVHPLCRPRTTRRGLRLPMAAPLVCPRAPSMGTDTVTSPSNPLSWRPWRAPLSLERLVLQHWTCNLVSSVHCEIKVTVIRSLRDSLLLHPSIKD